MTIFKALALFINGGLLFLGCALAFVYCPDKMTAMRVSLGLLTLMLISGYSGIIAEKHLYQ